MTWDRRAAREGARPFVEKIIVVLVIVPFFPLIGLIGGGSIASFEIPGLIVFGAVCWAVAAALARWIGMWPFQRAGRR